MEKEILLLQIEHERYRQFQHQLIFKVPSIFNIKFDDFFNNIPSVKDLDQDRKYNWAIQQPEAPMQLATHLYSQTPKQAFESLLITANPTMEDHKRFNPYTLLIAISEVEDNKLRKTA